WASTKSIFGGVIYYTRRQRLRGLRSSISLARRPRRRRPAVRPLVSGPGGGAVGCLPEVKMHGCRYRHRPLKLLQAASKNKKAISGLGPPLSETGMADRGTPPNLEMNLQTKALGHPHQIFLLWRGGAMQPALITYLDRTPLPAALVDRRIRS